MPADALILPLPEVDLFARCGSQPFSIRAEAWRTGQTTRPLEMSHLVPTTHFPQCDPVETTLDEPVPVGSEGDIPCVRAIVIKGPDQLPCGNFPERNAFVVVCRSHPTSVRAESG